MASRSEESEDVPTPTTTTVSIGRISKKQRGRHKKLRKRALEYNEGCETTGIVARADWEELIQLEKLDPSLRLPIRPSVRKRRNHDKCQNAEGVDHRDIIYQALGSMNQSKKRSQKELSSAIPSWATLHNIAATQSLVVVELQLQDKWESVVERLPTLMADALPVTTRWFQGPRPKSITDALMYFSSSPPTASNKKMRSNYEEKDRKRLSHASLLKPLLLTSEERRKEGYPMMNSTSLANETGERHDIDLTLPTFEKAKLIVSQYQVPAMLGEIATELIFVRTRNQCQASQPRVVALDCEMVQTSEGTALARITLVQLDTIQEDGTIEHTVVLDELVKPSCPVLDYVTQYSGITAAMLNPVKTRLEQIQAFLVLWLNKDDIIVGHSLDNDFRAIQLIHDIVVDTSVLFRGKSHGRKYALKHLTAALLKRIIQNENVGHCSEQDAVASLELAVRRARIGPSFRICETSDNRVHLLECLKHNQDHPVVCIGPSKWLKTHVTQFSTSAHALTCDTIEDDNRKALTAWLVNIKRRAKLVWANFVIPGQQKGLDLVHQTLADLMERALPGTLVLVALQSGLEHATTKAAERNARMNPRASLGWTDDDERNCRASSDCARSGYALWLSK